MYRFFVQSNAMEEEYINITGDDVNHIKNVLRMKIGEEILISNGQDKEYCCIIDQISAECIKTKIIDVLGSYQELPVEITLFQGYPKSDKLELIIQKAVELGALRIVPVMTKRCVVKLDEKKAEKKVERFNQIALSAAKQAKRGKIPEVTKVVSFKEAIKMAAQLDMNIIPYEEAEGIEQSRKILSKINNKKSIGIFIGPEGGFDTAEIALAQENNIECITLGHRILRTETAGMAILSIIMFQLESDQK